MKSTTSENLVHESETQRQYPRVKVPGRLVIDAEQGTSSVCSIRNLSNGGLSFDASNDQFSPGHSYTGRIEFEFRAVSMAVPVRFRIAYIDKEEGSVGVAFEELGADQVALVRRIVIGFITGELADAGEMIHTLSRDNFTSPRRRALSPSDPSPWVRFRAMAQTFGVLVVGIVAFFYAVNVANDKLFTTASSAARVAAFGSRIQVKMPRDGIFKSLVTEGVQVEKGTPIALFSAGLAELVDREALADKLPPEQIDALLATDITGTVTSPCDCRVVGLYSIDDQYLNKGERLMELAPLDVEPLVVARFGYQDAAEISPGAQVTLRINGDSAPRTGVVAQWPDSPDMFDLDGQLLVVVRPDEPIPADLINRPVEVSISGESWLATVAHSGSYVANAWAGTNE